MNATKQSVCTDVIFQICKRIEINIHDMDKTQLDATGMKDHLRIRTNAQAMTSRGVFQNRVG